MTGDAERIGIFGGTFDPPHIGHLASALAARDALSLDRVLLVVANVPWQKVGSRTISSAEDRLAMVEAAVVDIDGLEASDLEIVRGGNSYTVETLEQLRASDPSGERFVILGADAATGIRTWERADELPGLATLVLIDRPGIEAGAVPLDAASGPSSDRPDVSRVLSPPGLAWPATHVVAPRLEVSSTDLRQRARDGRSLDILTPPGVVAFIKTRGIYRGSP